MQKLDLKKELKPYYAPPPGKPAIILDVGHNPQAAGVLADNLGNMGFYPETWAVFGMLNDKDVAGVVALMAGPLVFFRRQLDNTKQRAILVCGALAGRQLRAFEEKWLGGGPCGAGTFTVTVRAEVADVFTGVVSFA